MKTDILIVGAGLAGLALADLLEQQGRDWMLVEALDRPGGRILSPELAGANFDLGPAWFWPGQPRMEAATTRFGLTVFEQYSQGALLFQDQSGEVQANRGYASMQGSLRISGGVGKLIEAYLKELPEERVLFHSPLVHVEEQSDGVVAKAGNQLIKARRIVLAVPPRVIAENVTFSPDLPEAAGEALASIPTWMAGQAKIVAVYDRPYWRDAGYSGDAMSMRGPMVEIHDASPAEGGPYGLFGFVGVAASVRAEHADQVLDYALQQLVALFGPEMANPKALLMRDWAQEPRTATERDKAPLRFHPAYGLPPPLRDLWSGKVIFGSTETARTFGGFLEGALEAAETVAGELAAAPADKLAANS